MAAYRTKLPPHFTVDAERFVPVGRWPEHVVPHDGSTPKDGRYFGYVDTIAGRQWITDGDWIVTGSGGTRIVLNDPTFHTVYEPVGAD